MASECIPSDNRVRVIRGHEAVQRRWMSTERQVGHGAGLGLDSNEALDWWRSSGHSSPICMHDELAVESHGSKDMRCCSELLLSPNDTVYIFLKYVAPSLPDQ